MKRTYNSGKVMKDNHARRHSAMAEPIPMPDTNFKSIKDPKEIKKIQSVKRLTVAMRKKQDSISLKRNSASSLPLCYPLKHIQLIQRKWRQFYQRISLNVQVIQTVFLGYSMRKRMKIFKENRLRGLAMLKRVITQYFFYKCFIKQRKPKLDRAFYSKKVKALVVYRLIRLIQREIRRRSMSISLPIKAINQRHCFIKDGTCNITLIKRIQIKYKAYLKRTKRRKRVMKEFKGVKVARPLAKILLLQRFIRYVLVKKKKIRPTINKDWLSSLSFFSKETHPLLVSPPKTTHCKLVKKRVKYKTLSRQAYYTKTIGPISHIILIQVSFRHRSKAKAHFLPKINAYSFFSKRDQYKAYYIPIEFIQSQIKFYLLRLHSKFNIKSKPKMGRMKFTKQHFTHYSKLLHRAIQVRLKFDRELINFIVTLIRTVRRHHWKQLIQMMKCYLPLKNCLRFTPSDKEAEADSMLDIDQEFICFKRHVNVFQASHTLTRNKPHQMTERAPSVKNDLRVLSSHINEATSNASQACLIRYLNSKESITS